MLSNISVLLVDENDIPINFTIGPPTITKLRFKEMDNDSNTFYVQISNLDSNDIYVDNNRSWFRSKLPKSLHLRDKWSVAVSRIYLPPKIMNIANPINIIEFQTQPSDSSDFESYTKHVTKVIIPPTLCTTVSHLISILNTGMLQTGVVFKIDNEKNVIYMKKNHRVT